MKTRFRAAVLAFILIGYTACALVYALSVARWYAPDEPWHIRYVQSLADGRGIPRVAPPSLGDATGDPYATHQAQHPPLFYLLAAPVYKLTALGGDTEAAKFALRLVSLVFGLATLCLTHALLRRVWPESDIVTLGVPAFVAFTPLFGLMSGVVNNDGLAILLATAVLFLLVRHLDRPRRADRWWLAAALGLAALTKQTTLFLFALAPPVFYWRASDTLPREQAARAALRDSLAVWAASLPLWLWWPLFNKARYGAWVVYTTPQAQQAEFVQTNGAPAVALRALGGALTNTLFPAWVLERLGRLGIPWADDKMQRVVLAVLFLAGAGYLLGAARKGGQAPETLLLRRRVLALCALGVLLLGVGVVHYTLTVDFTVLIVAGRYFLPLLPAITLLTFIGLARLRPRPGPAGRAAALALVALLALIGAAGAYVTRAFYTRGIYLA